MNQTTQATNFFSQKNNGKTIISEERFKGVYLKGRPPIEMICDCCGGPTGDDGGPDCCGFNEADAMQPKDDDIPISKS